MLLEYAVGRHEQGDQYLDTLLQATDQSYTGLNTGSFVCMAVVPLAGQESGEEDKFNLVRTLMENAITSPSPPLLATMARSGLALIANIENDATAAREQYGALHPQRGILVPNCAGCTVDRVLGLLSHTMGNLDQATRHFDDALAFCRKAGYRPELAWTRCDYADALRERKGV